ncbi:MAG: CRISPR-associated endoribonuclease Cas6 [Candidatus Ancillula sp.]|nr:CRISPR-associated endoribonuclease Cas6 [Candidatus Ancillula sp.]
MSIGNKEEEDSVTQNLAGAFSGAFLQGVLMEEIAKQENGADIVNTLHGLTFNPYSQYLYIDKNTGSINWVVNSLTDEADNFILKPLLNENFKEFYVKAISKKFVIENKEIKELLMSELTKNFYQEDSAGVFEIQFLTPTSFRQNNKYQFQFDFRLFWQSLVMKYGFIFEQNKEPEVGLLDELAKYSHMLSYSLHSYYYNVGGYNPKTKQSAKIPGFIGRIKIKVTGAQTLKNYAAMLLRFSEFCGIGIKTSMGMGGVKVNNE